MLRRTIATLVALGLAAFCGYLLFSLIWAPRTYFTHLSAGTYAPLNGRPVLFSRGDSAAFKELEAAFAACDLADAFETPLTRRFLEDKLADLAESGMRKKDTLIVYLTAHGIVRGDEASILCERNDGSGEQDLFAVSSLLEALVRSPAGTKLLILDAARNAGDSPGGTAINTFPKLLEAEVKKLNDPTLWVLSANAALERSHVSHAVGQSVMGFMVAKGLGGLADQNSDQIIRLDELYQYVRAGVSAWVDQTSAGNESQTPTLLNLEPGRLASDAPVLVSVKWLPEVKALNVREDMEQSAEQSLSQRASGLQSLAPAGVQQAAARVAETADSSNSHEAQTDAENKAEDATAAVDQPKPQGTLEAGVNYGGLAQQELNKVWQEAGKLETSSTWTNPSYIAPPLWREFLGRLLWHEQFIASDVPAEEELKWRPVINELTGFDQSLAAYANQDVQPSPADNLVERIQSFTPKVPLKSTPDNHISLALVELIASHSPGAPISKELAAFIAEYDAVLAKEPSTPAELAVLIEKSKDAIDPSTYYELRLLDLSRDANIPWNLVRLALRTRRVGEKVSANLLCGQGWSRQTIEDADRLRWEGERHMVDQTNTTWPELAETKLESARSKYEQAARELLRVRGVTDDRDQLLRQLPQFVRLAHLSGRDRGSTVRSTAAIKDLMTLLASIDEALATPGAAALVRLEQLHGQLIEAREALKQQLNPSGSAWKIANLLSTTLPPADQRAQLQNAMEEAETSQMSAFALPDAGPVAPVTAALSDQRWNEAREQIDLELAFARLAGFDESLAAQLEQSLSDSNTEGWQRVFEAREALQELYDAPPKSIQAISVSSDLSETKTRPERLAALHAALRHWLLLEPRHQDEINLERNNLIAILSDALWYDLLNWQSSRFQRSADDAPLREVAYLRNSAAQYRSLATDIPGQPAVDALELPQLAIEATEKLSLVANDEVPLPFTVKSLTTEERQIWLVAQYNGDLLQVDGPGVLSQDALRAEATEKSRNQPATKVVAYPYRPDDFGLDGVQLSANGSTNHTLRIKRRTGARGTSKLILKAISGDTYVRRELDVELPGLELLQIAVDAGPEFWTATNEGVVLHPLPNHVQEFAFNIVNRERVAKELEVSFLIPARAPDSERPVVLPPGALRPETANRLLAPFGQLARLGPTFPISLPASSEPVRVQSSATADPKPDPQANLLAPTPEAAKEFAGTVLRHGLLVDVLDKQTGERTIRRVEIAPQRPRRYLNAIAQYDASTDRLQVDVTAASESAIPPEGCRIKFRIAEGVSSQREKRLEAVLKSPDYSARLYAYLHSNAPQDVTAMIDVDDYPRAFIFNVSRGTTSADIRPVEDMMGVRIVAPSPGTAYRAPQDKIAATVEVDAPEDSFAYAGSTSYVEVGVDTERDGELREDPKLELHSDRQLEVTAQALSPAGALSVDTRVGDFRLELPSTGLSDLTAELRGRVASSLGERWSDPVEVIFDGTGPELRIEFEPDRVVERGADLLMRALTDEFERSGVQSVEAVFESVENTNSGDAAQEKTPWVKADPKDSATWVATLKTDKLSLGPQTLLIRATDRVENQSVQRQEITIVEKGPVRKTTTTVEPASLVNTVSGSVMYFDERVPEARVVLESAAGPQIAPVTSGNDGSFTFEKVPPGAYTVKSEKVIRNRNRKAELQITVPPRPKTLPRVTLKLGGR